jgi:Zn-dependent protease with chaperone function
LITTEALYFDGRQSQARRVRVSLNGRDLWIEYATGECFWPTSELRITPQLGSAPQGIFLPEGGKLEVANHDFMLQLEALTDRTGEGRWLHHLESRYRYVILAVSLALGLGWLMISQGVPLASRYLAFATPLQLDLILGEEVLALLDKRWLEPSKLPETEQQHYRQLFQRMVREADAATPLQLQFRAGGTVGANAFALPSGIVVVTDELIELAQADAEVMGVFAHEIGHLVYRHGVRHVLQDSLLVLLTTLFVGDAASSGALLAALPVLLVESHYSREFESEADRYAVLLMQRAGLDRQHLGRMLQRLGESHGGEESGALSYLSTHPMTQERIEMIAHWGQGKASDVTHKVAISAH